MIIHIYHKVQQTTKEHSRLQQGLIITLRCVRLDRPAARGWWQRSNSGRHNVDFLYFGFDGYIYCKTLFLLQQLSQKKKPLKSSLFFYHHRQQLCQVIHHFGQNWIFCSSSLFWNAVSDFCDPLTFPKVPSPHRCSKRKATQLLT